MAYESKGTWSMGRDVQDEGRVATSTRSTNTPTEECPKRNLKTGWEQYMKPS